MKHLVVLPLVASALVALTAAQELPTPHANVVGLERFAGHFKGAGTLVQSPGGEPVEWHAVEHTEAVLGGFAFQSKMTVDLGPAMPEPYMRDSLTAYDGEAQEFLSLTVDSLGSADLSLLRWLDDQTLCSSTQSLQGGRMIRERSIARLTDKGYELVIDWTIDDSESFHHVVGSFERVESGGTAVEAGAKAPALRGAVESLARLVGTWESSGWMLPGPAMEKIEISGKQVIAPVLGGSVLREEVSGKTLEFPMEYSAISYIYHDPVANCFRHLGVTNRGEVARSQGWVLPSGSICFTSAGSAMGMPICNRTLIEFDDKGPLRMSSDLTIADTDAARYFQLDYPRD